MPATTMNSTQIKIRAHHLLCMQGFQGYGYSDSFTNHLNSITMLLRANPDSLVQVVAECDKICNGCPNRNENRCEKYTGANQRIKTMDLNILKCIGINPGNIIKIGDVTEVLNNAFKTHSQLIDICGNCQWRELCLWYLSREKS